MFLCSPVPGTYVSRYVCPRYTYVPRYHHDIYDSLVSSDLMSTKIVPRYTWEYFRIKFYIDDFKFFFQSHGCSQNEFSFNVMHSLMHIRGADRSWYAMGEARR